MSETDVLGQHGVLWTSTLFRRASRQKLPRALTFERAVRILAGPHGMAWV